ncbi:LmeA family phospholipid-binding protein [Actinoplanes friuliensis]|uniref:DUF2993 domain-containing protein n=1 Tax=Actinoplanes friuliensis DSM 7358 TaxID=1246995 RepID=U5WEM7_9ACTN|nr:DUF2993 domain-containing protein [Actinoplanes friuliensis]AGZ46401.1 hypothetical protein AFR_40735 [Actinoplanes friuliensis DSM 7358]
MAEVYGSARPRKRWGRRLLITFVVLLLLILAVLVVADRMGASYAERVIGDRVTEQLTQQKATSEKPKVSIEGVPFLTQVLAGKYQEIKIGLDNFSGPAGNGKDIKMPLLDISAKDVDAPLDTVRTGNGDIVASTVTGAGTIGYANLAELTGQPGLKLSERGGKLVGAAPIEALGQTFNASGTANLEVKDGVVKVTFANVTADGLPDIPLVRSLVDTYVQKLAFDLKVPALPLDLKVQKVQPTAGGLVVTAGASNVSLSSGGL